LKISYPRCGKVVNNYNMLFYSWLGWLSTAC